VMAEPAINPLDYGRPPRPCCSRHGVEMHVKKTLPSGQTRECVCPVPGCGQKAYEPTRFVMRRPRRL
jgi:hypothetical protein